MDWPLTVMRKTQTKRETALLVSKLDKLETALLMLTIND